MNEFIANITSFPVVIFTFLMVFICIYWLLVLLGAMDFGFLDFGGLDDIDIDGSELSGISGVLANWGLAGVPVTIVTSLITSLCWLMTSIVTAVLFPYIASPYVRFLFGVGLIFIVIAISIPITARMIRPMRHFFNIQKAVRKSTLVGQECVVKTLTVTEKFGQGEVFDGEAGILVDIIAQEPNTITKGDAVMLVEYDKYKDSYYVSKL